MKFKILILLLCAGFMTQAQEMFSYVKDKKFKDPSDLMGYNFVPNHMEIPNEAENELNPGDYSFGITRNNLYVHGEGISGVYSLNNINPTEYGFKLLLMNARDPTIQGHLKIILTKKGYVDALVFKRSKKDKEIIFFQALMPKEKNEVEAAFFTDRWETELEMPDSIWGMEIHPFFRIHLKDNTQERLEIADSTSIRFIEKVTIIDKTKKKKVKKKKRKKEPVRLSEEEAAEEELTEEATDNKEINEEEIENIEAGSDEETEEKEVKKKLKIIKEYFVEVRSILHYDDGEVEDKKWTYKVKHLKEREDATAGPDGERFQIEFETNKGEPLYLYLTPKRTISSMELGKFRYLMRGH
ncbi:MAG TPA: hypothetical protein ENK52_03690 [Saprospiraceae bacterium]|nr:hypothetical protein [Saprospiraceae bacterium]